MNDAQVATDSTNYWTATALKKRDWTEKTIGRYLPEPDLRKPNPHCRSAAEMRLYSCERLEREERSQEWLDSQPQTRRRKEAAEKAAATKRRRLLEQIEQIEFSVPRLPLETITQLACQHYNQ